MAPSPAPATAAAPAVGVEDEVTRDQDTAAVSKSVDISMGVVKDDVDLPVPCSMPAGGKEVASEPVEYNKGGDTTESSSSFGDTFSGFEEEADGGEPEVNSQVPGPADGDLDSMLPRKKVTAGWRNSVRPIMWRCQWLELRMKDLSSQVSRYDRELALIEKEKEPQKAVSEKDGSMPDTMLNCKDNRNSSMERRKRNAHEDSEDTSSYIKKHPILSYYNDKQNKGAETDGLVVDDDCSNPGGLDAVALLDAKEYDTILEQVALTDILSTIDVIQSQVNLLKDRLNKAHLEEGNLAFSEHNTHIRVPRKRKISQKFRDTTYVKYQNTKPQKYQTTRPQKRKNLNILLKDDDGPVLAVKPGFPDIGTNCKSEDAKGNSGGRSGDQNLSQDRAITVDLLLGVDNSLANGHMGDLCKEVNADDILIDNRTANEGCPQFEKIEHLPSEASKDQKTSEPVEVKTSAPVKVDGISSPLKIDSTSTTVIDQEQLLEKLPMLKPVKKRGWKPKERKQGWGSASSSMNHCIGVSTTSASEQKSKGAPLPAKETERSTPTDLVDLEIMTPLSAWKKRKAGNKFAAEEEHKGGNVVSKKQKTEKSSSGTKNRKTEKSSSAAKEETENSSPAAKTQETESTQSKLSTQTRSKLRVEKAVLVAVNSRRSQRVRKPKVY